MYSMYRYYSVCLQVQRKHPELATTFNNTLQKIDVHFSALELLLHQEAILNVLQIIESIKPSLETPKPPEETPTRRRRASSSSMGSAISAVLGQTSRPGSFMLPFFSFCHLVLKSKICWSVCCLNTFWLSKRSPHLVLKDCFKFIFALDSPAAKMFF